MLIKIINNFYLHEIIPISIQTCCYTSHIEKELASFLSLLSMLWIQNGFMTSPKTTQRLRWRLNARTEPACTQALLLLLEQNQQLNRTWLHNQINPLQLTLTSFCKANSDPSSWSDYKRWIIPFAILSLHSWLPCGMLLRINSYTSLKEKVSLPLSQVVSFVQHWGSGPWLSMSLALETSSGHYQPIALLQFPNSCLVPALSYRDSCLFDSSIYTQLPITRSQSSLS